MLPKKSNDIIEETFDEKDLKLTKDFINFVYSEFRDSIENLERTSYYLPCFHFTTDWRQFEKIRNHTRMKMHHKKTESAKEIYRLEAEKFNKFGDKLKKELDERTEAILRKLQWHKENGDPYGVYKKKLESHPEWAKKLSEKE